MFNLDLRCVEETGSTNDDLLLLAEKGAPEGTAIATRHQLQGKGRRGRIWVDEPGQSALVSVLIRPDTRFTGAPMIAIIASVAVAVVLQRECNLMAGIKWPNDLLVGEGKIGGILIEGKRTARGMAIAIGVGVNIKQTKFPDELSGIATSVVLSGGLLCPSEVLSEAIAQKILAVWTKWNTGGQESIFNQWVSKLWGIGRKARVESLGEIFECTIKGANHDGSLRVITDYGTVRTLVTADSITFLKIY